MAVHPSKSIGRFSLSRRQLNLCMAVQLLALLGLVVGVVLESAALLLTAMCFAAVVAGALHLHTRNNPTVADLEFKWAMSRRRPPRDIVDRRR